MAASSPARRSTSMAARTITDLQLTAVEGASYKVKISPVDEDDFRREDRNPPSPGAKADARPVSRRQPNHRVGPVIRAKRVKQVLTTAPDRGVVMRSSARTAPRDYLNAFSGIADTGNHRARRSSRVLWRRFRGRRRYPRERSPSLRTTGEWQPPLTLPNEVCDPIGDVVLDELVERVLSP